MHMVLLQLWQALSLPRMCNTCYFALISRLYIQTIHIPYMHNKHHRHTYDIYDDMNDLTPQPQTQTHFCLMMMVCHARLCRTSVFACHCMSHTRSILAHDRYIWIWNESAIYMNNVLISGVVVVVIVSFGCLSYGCLCSNHLVANVPSSRYIYNG